MQYTICFFEISGIATMIEVQAKTPFAVGSRAKILVRTVVKVIRLKHFHQVQSQKIYLKLSDVQYS